MLHGVHIQIAFGQGFVGLYKIVEFDDLDGQALFFCFFSYLFHDFRMGAGRYADGDFLFVGRAAVGAAAAGGKYAGRGDEGRCKEFFDRRVHELFILSDTESITWQEAGWPAIGWAGDDTGKKKSRRQMTALVTYVFICRMYPLDLAPIPFGGCRSVIGPFPRLLLMKSIYDC